MRTKAAGAAAMVRRMIGRWFGTGRASPHLDAHDIREAQESREYLLHAQRIARIGSSRINLKTGKVEWSAATYALFGVDPTKVEPGFEPAMAVTHPEDRARHAAAAINNRAGCDDGPIEFRVMLEGGGERWIRRAAEVLKDPDGTPATVIVTTQDITESRRIEAELRRNREHLARAQSVGNIGSAEVDLRTGKVFWSDELFALFGLDPARTPPSFEAMRDLLLPAERIEADRIRAVELEGKTVGAREFRITRPDGEARWLLRQAEIITDSEGGPATLVSTFQDVTLPRRNEEALRHSQYLLAAAQRIGRIGSSEVDLRTGERRWSDEMFRLFDFDRNGPSPPREAVMNAVHPDDRDHVQSVIRRNLAGVDAGACEYRVVRRDGSIVWHERVAEFLYDEAGAPRTIIVVAQDITERKRREEELRHSREHLTRVQSFAMIASIEFDYRAKTLIWSDEMYRFLRLDPATTRPNMEASLVNIHPDDRPMLLELGQRNRRGEDVPSFEFRLVEPDGSILWLVRHAHIIRDAAGRPATLIATHQDISERKRNEEALRRSREHLERVQRVARIGSTEVDIATQESVWSEEIYDLLGIDRSTKPGFEEFLAHVHPDDHELMRGVSIRGRRGEDAEPIEYRIVKGGVARWMVRNAHVERDADGRPLRLLVTNFDIDDRKRAQEQRDELERQLLQAQKMEAIGKLAGGVAHDFNNLLTVIMGRLEMLGESLADRPELEAWVRTCIRAAGRGASLTRSMLAFSRQQPLKPTQIDVASSIDDMVELLPRTLGETIGVKVELAPDLWHCEADPAQLQNTLLNLALNARDAMPAGGRLIIEAANAHLDAEYAARNLGVSPGDYVALSVTDTGTGMPPEIVARAFDPFFTTKESGKGTGLGLSMVYGFAKQSGGHVSIHSEVGHGSTVRIYLPRAHAVAATLPSGQAALQTVPKAPILVVEDNDDVRALTVAQLKRLGYTSYAAADASEGLRLLDEHPDVALLLTDVTLPGGLSGRALAERALARRPELKVLYMSGYTENGIIHQGRLDPGVHLLQKPFTIEQLAEGIAISIQ